MRFTARGLVLCVSLCIFRSINTIVQIQIYYHSRPYGKCKRENYFALDLSSNSCSAEYRTSMIFLIFHQSDLLKTQAWFGRRSIKQLGLFVFRYLRSLAYSTTRVKAITITIIDLDIATFFPRGL